MKSPTFLIAIAALFASGSSFAGIFDFGNFQECMAEKKLTTPATRNYQYALCSKKYPIKVKTGFRFVCQSIDLHTNERSIDWLITIDGNKAHHITEDGKRQEYQISASDGYSMKLIRNEKLSTPAFQSWYYGDTLDIRTQEGTGVIYYSDNRFSKSTPLHCHSI